MKNKERKEAMPAFNQIFKDVTLQHLAESGLPESLADGVDFSTFENMERTLAEVKECFYSSIKKRIEETYGAKAAIRSEQNEEYIKRNWWEMFKHIDCDPENNKYIANLHSIVCMELPPGASSQKRKQLEEVESSFGQKLKDCMKEEDGNKLREYFNLESDIRAQIEKEGFICGFRTAYCLFMECGL